MNEDQSNLVMWLVMSVVIVFFVCAFLKNPALRFLMGFGLWIAGSIWLTRFQAHIAEEQFLAQMKSKERISENARRRLAGEPYLWEIGSATPRPITPAPRLPQPGDWMWRQSGNPLNQPARY